jgi:DNA polymerase III epsilon subunit-like protein
MLVLTLSSKRRANRFTRREWSIYPTKLSDVCQQLGIALNHHEALSDAMACAQIVLAANKKPATQTVVRRRNSVARHAART